MDLPENGSVERKAFEDKDLSKRGFYLLKDLTTKSFDLVSKMEIISTLFFSAVASFLSVSAFFLAIFFLREGETKFLFFATGAYCAGKILSEYRVFMISRLEPHLFQQLYRALVQSLRQIPPRVVHSARAVKFQPVLNASEQALRTIYRTLLASIMPLLFQVTASLLMLFIISGARISFILSVAIGLHVALSIYHARRINPVADRLRHRSLESRGILIDTVRNMPMFRMSGSMNAALTRIEKHDQEKKTFIRQLSKIRLVSGLVAALVIGAALSFVLVDADIERPEQIHTLALVVLFSFNLFRPLEQAGAYYFEIRNALHTLGELSSFIPRDTSGKDGSHVAHVKGDLTVIGFSTANVAAPPINIQCAAGEHVAVLGKSGLGKTSLVYACAKILSGHRGSIAVDGVEIQEWSSASIVQNVGFCFNEPYLLNDTIRENFYAAVLDISDNDIRALLERWCISDRPSRLRFSLETQIGERGQNLSSGERQRLGLAIAMARKPRMLICDEATASLDEGLEDSMIRKLREEMQGKTIVWFTHRSGSAQMFSRVLRLEA